MKSVFASERDTLSGLMEGSHVVLELARQCYVHAVDEGELTLADKGYRDPQFFRFPSPGDTSADAVRMKKIMARHETVNRRFKQFSVLSGKFRHDLSLHPASFHAVVRVTQIMIENGEPLYSVDPCHFRVTF